MDSFSHEFPGYYPLLWVLGWQVGLLMVDGRITMPWHAGILLFVF
jgi:hypothetical protein